MKKILAVAILILAFPPVSRAQPVQKEGKILFSNIAPGELEANKDLRAQPLQTMPVKITFASETGIPYGGVYVRIFNASGVAIFKHLCEKPWLYVQIPAGEYNVVAVDRTKVQRVSPFTVKAAGQTHLNLKWPKSVVGY